MGSGSGKDTPPVILVVGASGSGKTTLIERLIPELMGRGLRVGTIKHNVHGFEIDRAGKDSWRHKQAGADVSVIASPRQVAVVMDVARDCSLEELIPFFRGLDLVLAEGYKRADREKMEIFRAELQDAPLCREDRNLVALISDTDADLEVPRFSPHEVSAIADFLVEAFGLGAARVGERTPGDGASAAAIPSPGMRKNRKE